MMVRIAEHCESKCNAEGLTVARDLLLRGYVSSAGCLARSSLEAHLRRLGDQHDAAPSVRRPPIWLRIGRLLDAKIFDQQTASDLRRIAKVGHRCVHGRPVPYMSVAELLDRVRMLLVSHPVSDETLCDTWSWICEHEEGGCK